jgi:hypothetical protein
MTGVLVIFTPGRTSARAFGPPQADRATAGGTRSTNFENRFGLPAFYTLHVWAWKNNPNGTFTNWNPTVSCDAFADRN